MIERFLKLIGALDKGDRFVKVKSWRPSLDKYGICWPVLLVDRGSGRMTTMPIWNIDRLRGR